MQGRVANCPNCGGRVEFKAGTSLLAICSYCSSAVARTGDDVGELEVLGKVAPLAAINSPLSLGAQGRYRGRDFTLIGRLQLDYGLGPWNEWYAAFADGMWGWIAEAQGRAYITFEKRLETLPSYAGARVGLTINAGGQNLTIVERRKARFTAAEGELPYPVVPGREYKYCDLEGPNNSFGTIDYDTRDETEVLYLGEQVGYLDLFSKDMLRDASPEQAAGAVGMNCPNCGAAVELRAPDEAQRVTCSTCDSLLDCSQSELHLLEAAKRSGPAPAIALGSKGKLRGADYIVYGHILKAVTVYGVNYYWEEYLLRGKNGYRWLVCSDDHWSFVEPVGAGEVTSAGRGVSFRGKNYRHFQTASARVEALHGEFYWKVSVGERTVAADFICPPNMLSRESSDEEVSWSLGHYLKAEDVEAAFGLKTRLDRPHGAGAIQPNPWQESIKSMSRVGAALSVLLIVFAVITAFVSNNDVILSQEFAMISAGTTQSVFTGVSGASQPFEVKSKGALALTLFLPDEATWIFVSGHLIEQNSQVRRDFGIYANKSSGDTDLSNSRRRTVYLGSVPAGTYVVHVVPEWSDQNAKRFSLEARADPFFPSHVFITLLLLWILPVLTLAGYFSFEKSRWAESDHG